MSGYRSPAAPLRGTSGRRAPQFEVRWVGNRFEVVTMRTTPLHLLRRVARQATAIGRACPNVRRRARRLAWAAVAVLSVCGGIMIFSPWPFMVTLRHVAAMRNCDTARAVGLAPAKRGDPGYWPRLDRDKDGWACEPVPQYRRW